MHNREYSTRFYKEDTSASKFKYPCADVDQSSSSLECAQNGSKIAEMMIFKQFNIQREAFKSTDGSENEMHAIPPQDLDDSLCNLCPVDSGGASFRGTQAGRT